MRRRQLGNCPEYALDWFVFSKTSDTAVVHSVSGREVFTETSYKNKFRKCRPDQNESSEQFIVRLDGYSVAVHLQKKCLRRFGELTEAADRNLIVTIGSLMLARPCRQHIGTGRRRPESFRGK